MSLDLPLDAGESLPARQPYLFHPTGGETYPSRPRVFSSCRMSARASRPHILLLCLYLSNAASLDLPLDAGEVLPARQSYYSVFTCPTQRVLISRWTPARCSRPHILLLCLYLSNAASLDLPLDAGEVLPARQSYYSVFTCPTQRVLISRWTPARCSRPDNLTFFCLYLSNTASIDLPLDAGEVLPARQSYFLCLYLSNTASPGISLDAGEVLPARQSYFSCLYLSNTGVSISRWTPARCSRTDNLTFPVFTCRTRESQSSVGRRRGAPGQTILLFLSLPVEHGSLNLPLDAGEVLPARQTLFRLLAPKISNPVERDIPGHFGNLSFQSTTGEV